MPSRVKDAREICPKGAGLKRETNGRERTPAQDGELVELNLASKEYIYLNGHILASPPAKW